MLDKSLEELCIRDEDLFQRVLEECPDGATSESGGKERVVGKSSRTEDSGGARSAASQHALGLPRSTHWKRMFLSALPSKEGTIRLHIVSALTLRRDIQHHVPTVEIKALESDWLVVDPT